MDGDPARSNWRSVTFIHGCKSENGLVRILIIGKHLTILALMNYIKFKHTQLYLINKKQWARLGDAAVAGGATSVCRPVPRPPRPRAFGPLPPLSLSPCAVDTWLRSGGAPAQSGPEDWS